MTGSGSLGFPPPSWAPARTNLEGKGVLAQSWMFRSLVSWHSCFWVCGELVPWGKSTGQSKLLTPGQSKTRVKRWMSHNYLQGPVGMGGASDLGAKGCWVGHFKMLLDPAIMPTFHPSLRCWSCLFIYTVFSWGGGQGSSPLRSPSLLPLSAKTLLTHPQPETSH